MSLRWSGALLLKCEGRQSLSPAELRLLFEDETNVHRMTASAPPVVRYLERSRSGAYHVTEEAEAADRIGENLSAPLVQLIGGIIEGHDSEACPECLSNPLKAEDTTHYGPRHPVRRALMDYERVCRRRHRLPAWTDHAAGPVCAIMLRMMVEHGTSLLWASSEVGVSYARAERHVTAAAAFVTRWVEHWDHEHRRINVDPDCSICNRRRPIVDIRQRPRAIMAPIEPSPAPSM